ncbi:MAG: CehA/McbA family metallohydrolase [Oscillospiraceae bacterium]|nr:CehA/McbA family metallohydrolase [Oscillospiraceae bacterium]
MIQQAAFIGKNKMLKGALHCHTTRSDGRVTPEDVMKMHKENGYDFLALTDHRIYNMKNFAPELGLTIIPGMEFDNIGLPAAHGSRCFHTVCLGPTKEDGNGFDHDQVFESANVPDQESYQPYLDDIHAKNNLTIYCHPEWSGTPPRYFDKMKGNFAMEIWNTGCVQDNNMDMDALYWDDLLGRGIRLFGVAVDDGHAAHAHCKGWVMVNAENNVNSILNALKNGAFYSSCGPEIYDFYVKDGHCVIECSPVKKLRVHSDCHPTKVWHDPEGKLLTYAAFDIESHNQDYGYVRMSIMDENGNYAWTNPIFLD